MSKVNTGPRVYLGYLYSFLPREMGYSIERYTLPLPCLREICIVYKSTTRGVAMTLLEKIKETALSVAVIVFMVLLFGHTIAHIETDMLIHFLIGSLLVILGLALFIFGIERSVMVAGQQVGTELERSRQPLMIFGFGLLIGFIATIAEPDVVVIAGEASRSTSIFTSWSFTVCIAVGVGLSVAFALIRIILGLSYRWTMIILYALIALFALFVPSSVLSIAFDAGAAATGPMIVTFVLALGIGVSSTRKTIHAAEDSFGLVGLALVGPIITILLYSLLFSHVSQDAVQNNSSFFTTSISFSQHFGKQALFVAQAMLPLLFLLILFQFLFLHYKKRQLIRICVGFLYAYLGLVLFFVGVYGAFIPTGTLLGQQIARTHPLALIPIGFLFGGAISLSEPAVWVLADQVHTISGGSIKKLPLVLFVSIGIAFALSLSMACTLFSLHLAPFLLGGYAIALILTFFSPPLFTTIAFDSGAVASGPMTCTFLLAFSLGVAQQIASDIAINGFGTIAMVAMTPLITIQILGILYSRLQKKKVRKEDHGKSD